MQFCFDQRIAFAKGLQYSWQHLSECRANKADIQSPDNSIMSLMGGFNSSLSLGNDLFCLYKKSLTCRSQPHTAFRADQEWHAQFLLQTLYLLTERRLGHMQDFRRSTEVQLFGHHDKIA